ncbi:hypothetical protein BD413DRAFT_513768 [Trametes elegans]|nr:hypothetical protein BD413DRAFT_513768 [Trametes elegans]
MHRFRLTEQEELGRQYLESDPLVCYLSLTAHSVTCKRCGTTINLCPIHSYALENWVEHRSQCLRTLSLELQEARPTNTRISSH